MPCHPITRSDANTKSNIPQSKMKITYFRLVIAIAVVLTATLAAPPAGAETIVVKLWSRADRSGPDRAGNIVRAAELLNKQFQAAGVSTRVAVEVHENNARGYDDDALALLKAFAVGRGPDLFVAAHEWVGEFADAGYAMALDAHIESHPEYYGDVIPVLWEAVRYKGCVPMIVNSSRNAKKRFE